MRAISCFMVLYQCVLVASPARFELTTPGLGILCSILLSYGDLPINSISCSQLQAPMDLRLRFGLHWGFT
jgi:hypothetical protein